MINQIISSKLQAEQTLGYILNKLRNHDQIIKNLHELKGDGWRKMKYARGLFDRCVGFLSANDVNKEYIYLTEPFHCKLITSSQALTDECDRNKPELVSTEELFQKSDIIIIQGKANDFKAEITAELIEKMKKDSVLVIMSDDISFDKEALKKALEDSRLHLLIRCDIDFAGEVKDLPNVMPANYKD